MKKVQLSLTGVLFAMSSQMVLAQENYPDRPITIVVPAAAGGPSDTVARLVAQSMSTTLGQ
ncbi:tripartite tricarboxylate transporter substrate binding protein BugD, partial [Agrobacterium vitis]|nr:tripartite tricarboxylate transporter substrate binding protein BugD [Agrobacterium vitis]